jgi:hypothetical protein
MSGKSEQEKHYERLNREHEETVKRDREIETERERNEAALDRAIDRMGRG